MGGRAEAGALGRWGVGVGVHLPLRPDSYGVGWWQPALIFENRIGRIPMTKVGGIWFWRMGRLGGSFYVKRAKPITQQDLARIYIVGAASLLNIACAIALANV